MPFLPDSIRGENYDPEKDESFNMTIERFDQLDKNDKMDPSDNVNEQSMAEIPTNYTDVIKDSAFIGEVPFDTIMEGIENQFDDYINIEDKTNYVDIFYCQLDNSYKAVTDNTETFQDELLETLDGIYQKFIDKMNELFNTRLTLTISDIEDEIINKTDDIEFTIRKLYEFFILDARKNFKIVIANDAKTKIGNIKDHKEYLRNLRDIMNNYSPYIITFGPMEFLKYRGDQDIIQLFEDGKVIGNFLRKYSMKLYQNEEFEVELINHITMVKQFKEEVFNNG